MLGLSFFALLGAKILQTLAIAQRSKFNIATCMHRERSTPQKYLTLISLLLTLQAQKYTEFLKFKVIFYLVHFAHSCHCAFLNNLLQQPAVHIQLPFEGLGPHVLYLRGAVEGGHGFGGIWSVVHGSPDHRVRDITCGAE